MELYLKRYFWVAILASIAASTLLVARTANTFVGSALEPAPLLGLDAPRTAPTAASVSVDAKELGHLFGIVPPEPVLAGNDPNNPNNPLNKQSPSGPICWTCDPVKSGLRLQLLATMVATPSIYSSALISDLEKQESVRFTIGDKIRDQYEVHDIIREPQRVIIVNDETHRLEYIDGTPGTGATLADAPKLPVSPVPGPGNDQDGIKKLGDNKYEISRAKLDSTLADMNSLATQARIVPSFKNGQADGFKLFSIQPGSVYSAIGVENGDVIERINGFDINSPEKALEAYSRLKDSANFDIQVERRGQPVTMSYSIQ